MDNINIKQLKDLIMSQAEDKGFGTKPEDINVAEKIALIHSEISEAFEAYRHKNIDGKDGFKEELGDAVQRILHLCGIFDIDIEKEILKKN
jgi:NTP pyrophosphatase (non-canonical NTP hydrolase)